MRIAILLICCVLIVSCGKPPAPVAEQKPPAPAPSTVKTAAKPKPQPYKYHVQSKDDYSYSTVKRMKHCIYLEDVQGKPTKDRMIATATELWQNENRKWDEFTVWMVFGPMKDFRAGTYAYATFSPSEMTEFERVDDMIIDVYKEMPK